MSAELLRKLIEAGTPAELVAEVAMELGRAQAAAELLEQRRAKDRERKRLPRKSEESLESAETHGTPPKDNKSNPPSSEANASGCADPVKELFDCGVSLLTSAGQTEKQARSLIGKWRKAKSDGEVLTGLVDCRARAISNPVEWLEKRFKPARYVSASGYEYRGSLEQIEREAQRRHDNDTYWQVQVDKKQEARVHA